MTGFAVPLESNDDEIYKNEGQIHVSSLNELFSKSNIEISNEESINILSENLIKEIQRY